MIYLPHTHAHMRYRKMYRYLLVYAVFLLISGFLLDTPGGILRGLYTIISSESSLVTDFFALAGPGAALVNAGLVTFISVIFLYFSDEPFNGTTLLVVGLMSGFSLFGKNIANIWPILLGALIYTKTRGESFRKYTEVALMSTALSPIVSYCALDNGWGNPLLAILVGIIIGFIVPPLSVYTYRIQNGMNLYNVGFACGLVAMIIVPVMFSFEASPETHQLWATDFTQLFARGLAAACIFMVVFGLFFAKCPTWAAWAGYRRLLRTSGRAPSDFLRMFGPAPVLINMGINGLIALGFILAVDGDINGPTLGGILTIIGFSAFGKHACNILPLMCGVVLGSSFMHWSFSDASAQLALLFVTTMAPISGYFGWPYGVLAGFLHSAVVRSTSSPVAGMNLYNNGFSGGLISIFLYALILDVARHRKPTLQDKDFFEPLEHDEPITPTTSHELVEEIAEPHPDDKAPEV